MELNAFDAVIFDMDGVLTDSEPIWKVAMEEVFKNVGCNLTRQDFQKTVGLRLDEVVSYWYTVAPWETYGSKEVEQQIVNRMEELLREQATPLTGVVEALHYFRAKGLKIGLATSSYAVLINAILETLDIASYFDAISSAEFEEFGKPHPAVYITTARKLGVDPSKCLVIEDSLNGIISGKAAKMSVICIPEKTHSPEPKLLLADMRFEDMNEMVDYFESKA